MYDICNPIGHHFFYLFSIYISCDTIRKIYSHLLFLLNCIIFSTRMSIYSLNIYKANMYIVSYIKLLKNLKIYKSHDFYIIKCNIIFQNFVLLACSIFLN